jgi:hypothetical protein
MMMFFYYYFCFYKPAFPAPPVSSTHPHHPPPKLQLHLLPPHTQKRYHIVKQMQPAMMSPTMALSRVFFRWIASMTRVMEGRLPAAGI